MVPRTLSVQLPAQTRAAAGSLTSVPAFGNVGGLIAPIISGRIVSATGLMLCREYDRRSLQVRQQNVGDDLMLN
jgi:hypothetical protein